MPPDFFAQIGKFFTDLRESMADGLLFFGGPLDTAMAVLDIVATTLVLYYLLKLFRDSRAWQLMKGIILILAFALISNVVGLNTIGFLLNNTISILAIAFIVLFQPELRQTLETVGRNSFGRLSGTLTGDSTSNSFTYTRQLVEAIVSACDYLANTMTGALIIIERETKLGDLIEQENAVTLDANVTTALLKQIFYIGSPLHDGAVLIRDGRIAAARVHMPLSDNYHLRREFGTRHRAAVGASELGDTIAVVVSEERGTISLAVEGRLYVLSNADALRTQLHRLLTTEGEPSASRLGRFLGRQSRGGKKRSAQALRTQVEVNTVADGESKLPETNVKRRSSKGLYTRRTERLPRRTRAMLFIASLIVACGIWLYVQVTVNPIDTRTYTVNLSYRGTAEAAERKLAVQSLPVMNVQLTLTARQQILNDLSAQNISAYINIGEVTAPGLQSLPVLVETSTLLFTRTEQLVPVQVTVNIYEISH